MTKVPNRQTIYATLARQGHDPSPVTVELNLVALRMEKNRTSKWPLIWAGLGLAIVVFGFDAHNVIGMVVLLGLFLALAGGHRSGNKASIRTLETSAEVLCHKNGIPLTTFWQNCLNSHPYYKPWVDAAT